MLWWVSVLFLIMLCSRRLVLHILIPHSIQYNYLFNEIIYYEWSLSMCITLLIKYELITCWVWSWFLLNTIWMCVCAGACIHKRERILVTYEHGCVVHYLFVTLADFVDWWDVIQHVNLPIFVRAALRHWHWSGRVIDTCLKLITA